MNDDNKSIDSSDVDIDDAASYAVYCTLCKIGFNSTVSYRQHLKGEKHAKAEKKEFMKNKYSKTYAEAASKLKNKKKGPTTSDKEENEEEENNVEGEDDDAEVFTCNLCKKVCTGIVNYKTHLDGKHHSKQIKRQKLMVQLKSEILPGVAGNGSTSVDNELEALYVKCPQLKPFAYCEQCSKSFSGPEGYQQHLNSETHKKMMQKLALVAAIEKDDLKQVKPTSSSTAGDDDPLESAPLATCKECGKTFYDPIPYHQHMSSESHKKQVKKLELMERMRKLAAKDEDGSGLFKCGECNKVFSDPKAFYRHLSGSAHTKQKEKDQLLQELLQKFPDLLKDTKKNAKSDTDDSESDDDESNFLACSVCHKSFSGPENARDHFRSQKHLKTVKEKKRIKKIIEKQKASAQKTDKFTTTGNVTIVTARSPKQSTGSVFSDDFEVIE